MSVRDKARQAGEAMAKMRQAPAAAATEAPQPAGTRVPLDGPLPARMPVAQFLQHNPSLADREALSPGVTGAAGYKNLETDEHGVVHVKLNGSPKEVTEGTAAAIIQQRKAAQQALIDPLAPPKQPVAPLGDAIRQYGPAVVASMYPGIFEPNGYKLYQQKYGMSESGELLVPAYTAPPPPTDAQPAPSSSTSMEAGA